MAAEPADDDARWLVSEDAIFLIGVAIGRRTERIAMTGAGRTPGDGPLEDALDEHLAGGGHSQLLGSRRETGA